MSTAPDPTPSDELASLRQRVAVLERENDHLRRSLEPYATIDNPSFNPRQFQKIVGRLMLLFIWPCWVLPLAMAFSHYANVLPRVSLFGVPLVDLGGQRTRHPGMGAGFIAFGGAAIGAVSVGGLGIGLIAFGGGAIGLFAAGGGAIGIIAIGGGSVGLIAVGGGGAGRFVLATRGYGKHVFAMNRQDPEAIEFFCRYVPKLRDTVTQPMPVIPLAQKTASP